MHLPQEHEWRTYRIVREALANVVKHARATCASITLVRGTTVRVCVEDNGVGFGTPALAIAYGLAGMRDRITALGGRLHLDNRPSGSARVLAELPLPNDSDH